MTHFPQFFIDTADINYIKTAWYDHLSKEFDGKSVVGITTNPSAMHKANIKTMKEFEDRVRDLCDLVTDIRKDKLGVVYVQIPNSNMTFREVEYFLGHIQDMTPCNNPNGYTSIGIKLPPNSQLLEQVSEVINHYPAEINVTGIADCSTALKCFTFPKVRYVSIIPGRMEEKGLNAREQIAYVQQRAKNLDYKQEIITGSMRTLTGLKWAIEYDTVPTVGTTVFNLMFERGDGVKEFKNMWSWKHSFDCNNDFSPDITAVNKQLSIDFFNQMNDLGKDLYRDWLAHSLTEEEFKNCFK